MMKMSFIARNTDATEQRRKNDDAPRRRFSTVALIGSDGAGKTAVAKALLESCPLPLKYLYMGRSTESSNVALPTSRLVHKWKIYRHRRSLAASGNSVPKDITFHGVEHRGDKRGKLGACVRLLHFISEESYRQLVSWIYQLRGNVVLYDRHFLFDSCPPPSRTKTRRLTDQIHNWFLRRLYPRPGLVIFLDAPPEVLFARKQEVPIEHLQKEREALAKKQSYAKRFVTVDATEPFDQVISVVNQLVMNYCDKSTE
jgi:thymidylate kinase